MALKLRVISDHYKALGKRSSRLFGVTGGRIGRSTDNDWVLPDPDRYVSSHHCKVSFRAGKWILEDTSTNGVFVNGSDTPVSIEGPYSLQDGDRLRLGDYEILVSIDERNDFPPDASGQLPAPPAVRAKSSASKSPAKATPKAPATFGEDLGEELDITDLLSESVIQAAPPANAFDWGAQSEADTPPTKVAPKQAAPIPVLTPMAHTATGAAAAAPVPAAKPGRGGFDSLLETEIDLSSDKKNDDWQMQTRPYDRKTLQALTNASTLSRIEPERPKRADGPVDHAGIEAFCRGAGIDPAALGADTQSALLTLAGQMVREMVLGLMEALKGRSDIKARLRLNQPGQPVENNPLKLAASVDEAVKRLVDPHGSRYLSPIEAIRDSFAELRTHQNALVSAMQAATDELMSRIEPGELQERFDRGLKRGAILGAANKMKYWDLYVEFYQALNQRNEYGLPALFAEELARTYVEKTTPKKK